MQINVLPFKRVFSQQILHKLTLSLLIIWLLFPGLGFAQSLNVSTDRQTVEMGDIITLFIETDFQTSGQDLNLDRLNEQFQILGSQRSNNIEMINGDFRSSTRWQIQLLPKQIGELTIPVFSIDNIRSAPYQVTVQPVQPNAHGGVSPYFLESSISKGQPYVQEEVLYTLRFYYQGRLISGNIRPPQFGQTLITPIKEQTTYSKQLNGQNYTVYEWVYALYPQTSGTLEIPAPMFTGRIQYQGNQKGVQEVAQVQTLDVLPEPALYKQTTQQLWLPAKSFKISDQWQALPTAIRVGDSLTYTINLEAIGLKTNQLPSIELASKPEYKVYADKPNATETILASGVKSQWQLTQAIVPTQPGTLTLPKQTIHWWNTKTNQIETTELAGKTLQVLPPLQDTATQMAIEENPNLATAQPTTTTEVSRETAFDLDFLSIAALILWLLTMIIAAWIWRRNTAQKDKLADQPTMFTYEEPQKSDSNEEPHVSAPKTLVEVGDMQEWCSLAPAGFYAHLRQSLKQSFEIEHVDEIPSEQLQAHILQLEEHLFHDHELPANTLKLICDDINAMKKAQKPSGKADSVKSQLKSLYGR